MYVTGGITLKIDYNEAEQLFHLQTPNTSYIMQVVKGGYLAHIYWGRKLRGIHALDRIPYVERCSFHPNPDPRDRSFSPDTLPQELPGYGCGDFRHPAYEARQAHGGTASELMYRRHAIISGKPALEGLPATYAEADEEAMTLEIELEDAVTGLQAILRYTVFAEHDAIARSVCYRNAGGAAMKLQRALSMSVDFPHAEFDLLRLPGAWARERHIERHPLAAGTQSVESRRGSSSHQHNPFIALLSRGADEEHGEVYGFSLVYSGSFLAQAEVDQFRSTRVSMGLNPFDFEWLLEPGESFQTPEAVMVYSAAGLGGMSRTYHRLYRTRLCRGRYRDRERPVLVNNWEATYFDFTADKIEALAGGAAELGIELLVLDDGWFGKRNDDRSSLGDWFVNTEKLPGGLADVAKRVNAQGVQFGLWFEPEMISPDSELYRAHPDWCLHVPERRRTQARSQLILDFSREDVCRAVADMLTGILSSAPIAYVKWDMNRNMTEIGSAALPPERQRETAHRYMLGVYRVMEQVTSAFPEVLFESCSGGGGRFDPGMLFYMPQTWTSDNTDAVERLKIQYGTSLVYPASAMGAHVSAVPNHQIGRVTSLEMRGHVAMSGNLGYELDLTKFTEAEKTEVKEQVAFYKSVRALVQHGDMYRLSSPFTSPVTAWMFVSADRKEALLGHFRVLAGPNPAIGRIKLRGLCPDTMYRLEQTGRIYGGDELMYAGIHVPQMEHDFCSILYRFTAV